MEEPNFEQVRRAISTMTEVDESLFKTLLAGSVWDSFPLSYEGSFAFYSHRAGYFPMKFYDGRILAPFYSRNGRFSILRPLGKWDAARALALANYLFALSRQPVTFLRLAYNQFIDLSSAAGFRPISETSELQAMEDNRYPQLVIPVRKLLQSVQDVSAISAGSFPEASYLRRVLRLFEKQYRDCFMLHRFDERHLAQVQSVIDRWRVDFRSRYQRDRFPTPGDDRANLLLCDDDAFLVRPYECLLHRFAKKIDMESTFAFVAYVHRRPAGFLFLSRTSANCAALYANLALTEYRGLPYYMLSVVSQR